MHDIRLALDLCIDEQLAGERIFGSFELGLNAAVALTRLLDSGHPFSKRVLPAVFAAFAGGWNLATQHIANPGTRTGTFIRPLGVHPLCAPAHLGTPYMRATTSVRCSLRL